MYSYLIIYVLLSPSHICVIIGLEMDNKGRDYNLLCKLDRFIIISVYTPGEDKVLNC